MGIVQKTFIGHSGTQPVYNLTPSGKDLEQVVVALAKWGVKFLEGVNPQYSVRSHWFEFASKKKVLTDAQMRMGKRFLKEFNSK
jgi:hypothetical protein